MRLRVATALIILVAVAATPAAANTASKAARAVERKVERRYSEGRHVIAFCHRRSSSRYFCEYLILGNLQDGINAGREGRESGPVAEGDARVEVQGSALYVRLLGEPQWS